MSGPIEFPSKGAPSGSTDVVLGGIPSESPDPATGAVSGGYYVKGAIDEVRVWSVVREQEDVFELLHRTAGDVKEASKGSEDALPEVSFLPSRSFCYYIRPLLTLDALTQGLELYWRFDFDVVNCNAEYKYVSC
jgi:hypothetical protein